MCLLSHLRCLPRFLELLTHVDVEVRSAAGENIALLYEASQKCGMTLPCDEDIIEKFRVMSKDSSKKNSKKDRKVQRLVFRDIHATLAVCFDRRFIPTSILIASV